MNFCFKFKHTVNKNKGFTLVEMIIYMSLLVLLLTAIVNSILVLTTHYRSVKNTREIEDSAIAIFERVSRDIRSADEYDAVTTVFGVSNGTLSLVSEDIASGQSTSTNYYVQGDRLYLSENGVVLGPLSKSSVNVTALIFRKIQTGKSTAFKIELSLQSDQAAPNVVSKNFYTTVVMRGSY